MSFLSNEGISGNVSFGARGPWFCTFCLPCLLCHVFVMKRAKELLCELASQSFKPVSVNNYETFDRRSQSAPTERYFSGTLATSRMSVLDTKGYIEGTYWSCALPDDATSAIRCPTFVIGHSSRRQQSREFIPLRSQMMLSVCVIGCVSLPR